MLLGSKSKTQKQILTFWHSYFFLKQRNKLDDFSLLGELNICWAAEDKNMPGLGSLFEFIDGKSKPSPLLNMHGCTRLAKSTWLLIVVVCQALVAFKPQWLFMAFVCQALVAFKPHFFFCSSPSCCQAPVAFKFMFLKHELLSQSFFQVSLHSSNIKMEHAFCRYNCSSYLSGSNL